nr:hypothetical protein Ade03nite_08700 [Actinoplanes derwentensis]
MKGSNIYVRPVDHGGGQVGLQVIVAQVEGSQTTYIDLTPEMLTEHAEYAALQERLTHDPEERLGD